MTLLKKLRLEAGMTQNELAAYVCYGPRNGGVVSCFERNRHREHPAFSTLNENRALRQFAFALGYLGDPHDLLREVV